MGSLFIGIEEFGVCITRRFNLLKLGQLDLCNADTGMNIDHRHSRWHERYPQKMKAKRHEAGLRHRHLSQVSWRNSSENIMTTEPSTINVQRTSNSSAKQQENSVPSLSRVPSHSGNEERPKTPSLPRPVRKSQHETPTFFHLPCLPGSKLFDRLDTLRTVKNYWYLL